MGVSDAMHNGDIVKRLERLERRLQEMSSSRRLENAAVGAGGIRLTGSRLTVTDELGAQEVVRLGILDDGTQGLQIVDPDTGAPVDLHTIAFGARSDSEGTPGTIQTPTTGADFRDLPSPANPGPQVVVRVGRSGRMRVTTSARVQVRPYDSNVTVRQSAIMGFELAGPSGRSAHQWPKMELHTRDADLVVTLSRPSLVGGLTPGLYTVTCKYLAGYNSIATFNDRYIDVQPY